MEPREILYPIAFTQEELRHLLYVCDDVGEVYEEQAAQGEADNCEFIGKVSVTLASLKTTLMENYREVL